MPIFIYALLYLLFINTIFVALNFLAATYFSSIQRRFLYRFSMMYIRKNYQNLTFFTEY